MSPWDLFSYVMSPWGLFNADVISPWELFSAKVISVWKLFRAYVMSPRELFSGYVMYPWKCASKEIGRYEYLCRFLGNYLVHTVYTVRNVSLEI
jgi:hypothetical protein